jgi:hypothetical protein
VSGKGIQALEAQLRAPAPAGLRGLDDAHLLDLAEAIGQARHQQATDLAAAGDQALSHIPRLLRVPVRRALG